MVGQDGMEKTHRGQKKGECACMYLVLHSIH